MTLEVPTPGGSNALMTLKCGNDNIEFGEVCDGESLMDKAVRTLTTLKVNSSASQPAMTSTPAHYPPNRGGH